MCIFYSPQNQLVDNTEYDIVVLGNWDVCGHESATIKHLHDEGVEVLQIKTFSDDKF